MSGTKTCTEIAYAARRVLRDVQYCCALCGTEAAYAATLQTQIQETAFLATTKGFAIGSAALASFLLFSA
eukprot:778259-Rhodomonas_salina.1